MRRFFILIPTIFCLIGCSQVSDEEFSPASIALKTAPASFDKTFSSASIGKLSHSYLAPNETGKNVWLLLFDRKIPLKDRPANVRFEGYKGSQGPVTLLVVESVQVAGKTQWSVINAVPLGFLRGRKTKVSMRWLEPAKQKGPVLFVNKLDGGNSNYELIAFPNGWSQKNPVRQSFNNWMGLEEAAKYDYYSVDRKGFMCIAETYSTFSTNNSDTGPPYYEFKTMKYHFWDGSGWKQEN